MRFGFCLLSILFCVQKLPTFVVVNMSHFLPPAFLCKSNENRPVRCLALISLISFSIIVIYLLFVLGYRWWWMAFLDQSSMCMWVHIWSRWRLYRKLIWKDRLLCWQCLWNSIFPHTHLTWILHYKDLFYFSVRSRQRKIPLDFPPRRNWKYIHHSTALHINWIKFPLFPQCSGQGEKGMKFNSLQLTGNKHLNTVIDRQLHRYL